MQGRVSVRCKMRPWTSLCLLAGGLGGVLGIGLSEHPDIKAISVGRSMVKLELQY